MMAAGKCDTIHSTSGIVKSEVTAPDDCKTLSLHGKLSPIVCAPNLNGSIALRLSGDVLLPENYILSNCSRLELEDCHLVIEGDSARSLPPISVLSGACSVSLAGSAALALSSVAVVEGSVDFKVADSGATIVIQGKTSSDIPPSGLLIDGHKTAFSNDGELLAVPSVIDASIASRGAVVPEASTVAYEGGALVSTSEAFPETLRVRIPGAEEESVRRCTIATFVDSCPAVLPQIEVVNVREDEKRNWIPEYRGLSLCVRRVHGTVVTVR